MKAKTKLTKLWSILLALSMVVGMLPTIALAAGSATATADFTTDANAALALLNAAKTGTAESTWVGNTLTLNGVNFTTTAATAVKLPEDATIVLTAGTTNTITGGSSDNESCFGILAVDGLTIEGAGTLIVTGGNGTGDGSYSCGIATYTNVIISGTADVTVEGGTSEYQDSYGIYAPVSMNISGGKVKATGRAAKELSCGILSLDVTISGGKVEATGGTVSDPEGVSRGIFSGNATISGTADVTAEGGTAEGTSGASCGIYAFDSVSIQDTAVVTATGGTATDVSYGIYASDNEAVVTISGTAVVTAEGGESKYISCGIYSNGVTISGGEVEATGGTSQNGKSNGIEASGNVTISGGEVEAKGGAAVGDNSGIWANNNVTISNTADVTATGGTGNFSCGIRANVSVSIKDTAVVTAQAGAATGNSYGIFAYSGDVSISGGEVKATGSSGILSCGIFSSNNVTISGGEVEANGGTATSKSYGISANESVSISGGSLIAQGTTGSTVGAMNKVPSVSLSAYQWRTSESGGYSIFPGDACSWTSTPTYLEVKTATGFTVTFDANGGSGTMAAATGVSGTYKLPANGFTAPTGKQFKCWSVGGTEKAVGATINVTANTTVTAVWETIVTAVWETIPATSTEYDILDGANSSWTQNSDGSLSIRGSGAFSEFVGVKVDGKSVDEQYYTVKEGSTIVTLKAEYLSTLAAGPHTIQLIWKDGTASTTFNINVNNPNTGDNGGLALAAALLALSAAAIAASGFNRKRGKSSR